MLEFKDKKVLITGGTAGIGRAVALAFAQQGADVAIFGTNAIRAEETVAALREQAACSSQKFCYFLVDVSSKIAVDLHIKQLLEEFGSVEILVNNAGITRDGLLMKMSEEDWDVVLDTNLKSVYNTCQALIRGMTKARAGAIINIASAVALIGNPGQANYAASKSGMLGFSKALAKEVALRGITVNCVAPGFIQTPMTDVLTSTQKEAIFEMIPMGRLGECADIAQAVLFLAKARYITGQVLSVDGGMVM